MNDSIAHQEAHRQMQRIMNNVVNDARKSCTDQEWDDGLDLVTTTFFKVGVSIYRGLYYL